MWIIRTVCHWACVRDAGGGAAGAARRAAAGGTRPLTPRRSRQTGPGTGSRRSGPRAGARAAAGAGETGWWCRPRPGAGSLENGLWTGGGERGGVGCRRASRERRGPGAGWDRIGLGQTGRKPGTGGRRARGELGPMGLGQEPKTSPGPASGQRMWGWAGAVATEKPRAKENWPKQCRAERRRARSAGLRQARCPTVSPTVLAGAEPAIRDCWPGTCFEWLRPGPGGPLPVCLRVRDRSPLGGVVHS